MRNAMLSSLRSERGAGMIGVAISMLIVFALIVFFMRESGVAKKDELEQGRSVKHRAEALVGDVNRQEAEKDARFRDLAE